MNCQGCKNLVVNNFTCRKYCLATGDFCQAERLSDVGSPIKPINGQCPGFVNPWDIKAGFEVRPGVYVR